MEPRLRRQLARVEDRLDRVRRDRASAWTWAAFAVVAAVGFAARDRLGAGVMLSALVLIVLAALTVLVVRRTVARRTAKGEAMGAAARFVEARHPELDTSLLAAIELEPDLPDGRYGFLARRLIDDVLSQAHHNPWVHLVPDARLQTARVAHVVAAVACACLAVLLAGSPFVPGLAPRVEEETHGEQQVVVLPGDAEVERGRSVLVSAEFDADEVPAGAELVFEGAEGEGQPAERLSMSRSLDDPIFAARIPAVNQDLAYRVEWPGGTSPSYRLTVFGHPELVGADVLLRYPDYTGLDDERIADTRRVTAPEGTVVTLICRLTKPVASAVLHDEDTDAALPLQVKEGLPLEYEASFVLSEPLRMELALEDHAGRTNEKRTPFVFKVTTNAPPQILAGNRDVRVSPLEELLLTASITDDFGLVRYGVSYRLGGENEIEVVLGESTAPGHAVQAEHLLAFEDLGARPDQLLSFHFWAEDVDADGELRRRGGDLYFGEVRPFEEIFREGQAPAGGQGGGGGGGMEEEEDLSRLQHDVVLATWNVLRSGLDDEGAFTESVQIVRDAQQDVRDRLTEGDADMDRALELLDRARQQVSIEALNEALAPEQAAYQTLLEQRQREFDIAQSSQSTGSSRANAQGGPAQAQLQQLELRSSENRYETQSQARLDQEGARDTRQALSRLKELARRQQDLNERLRELQSELQAARTEEEREAARRRLKRLQEAQEEILRDTDELRQRMDESQSRQQLAEERERLDQTRENVRRASEALREGRLSQALTEGSRARRQLTELEQDLRDSSSGQFDDRLRELQREARRIEEEQGRLAQELRDQNENKSRSLSAGSDAEREALQRGFERQGQDLERLLESVEDTVQEAEETEPLLAEDLFDTLNEAWESRAQEALEMTGEMLERGFPGEAEEPEEIARKGLIGLRAGVESAAESVLGTGIEALERAGEELRRLSEDLDTELAGAGAGQPGEGAPLTGGGYLDWSDRLRDVEEIIDDPQLSAEAARLRSRARGVREDYKRHSKEPNWDLVQEQIAGPLGELGRLVEEEVRRRKAEDSLVPIDRDPVPPEFEEAVRRYYERLGRSR